MTKTTLKLIDFETNGLKNVGNINERVCQEQLCKKIEKR